MVARATSIGTDPDWLERGGSRRFGGVYWHRFGFGELGAGAKVRREVLHRLLPGLAIADRCRLDGRYLRVRGDVHAYRIHLGSGNVLMSPATGTSTSPQPATLRRPRFSSPSMTTRSCQPS